MEAGEKISVAVAYALGLPQRTLALGGITFLRCEKCVKIATVAARVTLILTVVIHIPVIWGTGGASRLGEGTGLCSTAYDCGFLAKYFMSDTSNLVKYYPTS